MHAGERSGKTERLTLQYRFMQAALLYDLAPVHLYAKQTGNKVHFGLVLSGATSPYYRSNLGAQVNLDEKVCYLMSIQVEEVMRRKGVGTRIVNAVKAFARAFDVTHIELTASDQSPAFWLANDFQDVNDPCDVDKEFGVRIMRYIL